MYVIKATSSEDGCFEGENLFLVASEDEADRIVGEFNNAAIRYERYIEQKGEFQRLYLLDHPYPVLRQVTFHSSKTSDCDMSDRYMTVSPEYLNRFQAYQEECDKANVEHAKAASKWFEEFQTALDNSNVKFDWNFPHSRYLQKFNNDLHNFSFCYESLDVVS